jgi:hypothetical protein
MTITLNSRTLVGLNHHAAAEYVSEYLPDVITLVEWQQNPSARCVLTIEDHFTKDRLIDEDAHAALLKGLESDLRSHLGLPILLGEEASGTEVL